MLRKLRISILKTSWYNANIYKQCFIRDPVLVKKIGAATALEVRATGIQYSFAPSIAVIESFLSFTSFLLKLFTFSFLDHLC